MTDKNPKDLKLELYRAFLEAEASLPSDGSRYMPYEWIDLPESIHASWGSFAEMLYLHPLELANIINKLTNNVLRIKAWSEIFRDLSDEEKMEALVEFVSMLAIYSLTLPHIIRSRFIFSTGNLCHVVNMKTHENDWGLYDLIEDKNISKIKDIREVCMKWKNYQNLEECIEKINGKEFRKKSKNFRNLYNHRFPPQIAIGVTRKIERGSHLLGEGYSISTEKALSLDEIASLLGKERDKCYCTFDAYKELVLELVKEVKPFDPTAPAPKKQGGSQP